MKHQPDLQKLFIIETITLVALLFATVIALFQKSSIFMFIALMLFCVNMVIEAKLKLELRQQQEAIKLLSRSIVLVLIILKLLFLVR